MSTVNEEILAVNAKISDLEGRIATAEREVPRVMEYIINLGQQLIELRKVEVHLRKKENILLGESMETGAVDKQPNIPSQFKLIIITPSSISLRNS